MYKYGQTFYIYITFKLAVTMASTSVASTPSSGIPDGHIIISVLVQLVLELRGNDCVRALPG